MPNNEKIRYLSLIWEIFVALKIIRGEAEYDFLKLHVQLFPKLDENV